MAIDWRKPVEASKELCRASFHAAITRTSADPPSDPFSKVLEVELAEIRQRREGLYDGGEPRTSLVGLALSGGGIRSATFSLGILQGLYYLGLLRIFDYLSTVSGGGFVGGWWSAWLARRDFVGFTLDDIRDPRALARSLVEDGLLSQDSESAGHLKAVISADRAGTAPGQPLEALRVSLVDDLTELVESDGLILRAGQDVPENVDRWLRDLGGAQDPVMAGRRANAWLLWELYSPALAHPIFPLPERVEPERAQGYVDPTQTDSGQAASDDPIHHLRLFANYITPRKGLLSPDTWRAAAVLTRNLLLTWCVLVPIVVGVVLLAQLYYVVQPFDDRVVADFTGQSSPILGMAVPASDYAKVAARPLAYLGLLLVFTTAFWMVFNDAGVRITRWATLATLVVLTGCAIWMATGGPAGGGMSSGLREFVARRWWDTVLLGIPMSAAAALSVGLFRLRGPMPADGPRGPLQQMRSNWVTARQAELFGALVVITITLAVAGFGHAGLARVIEDFEDHPFATARQMVSFLVVAFTAFGSVFTAIKASPTGGHDARELGIPSMGSRVVFAVTPPLVLAVVSVIAAWVGLEMLRGVVAVEGGRVSALTLSVISGISLCLVFALYEFHDETPVGGGDKLPRWLALLGVVLVFWIVFQILGASFAWAAKRSGIPWVDQWLQVVLAISVGLFFHVPKLNRTRWRIVGLAGWPVVVLVVLDVAARGWPDTWYGSPVGLRSEPLYAGLAAVSGLGAFVVALGWMADPNALSLHTFYKARLVRAYLGASNPRRRSARRDVTETTEGDDLLLQELATCRSGGPYHLINTTLNLVGGRDLGTTQRSAAGFVLSRHYCGSVRTGYRRTERYMDGEMTAGAGIAASGAAVSPTMGSRTPTAALSMLLAFLNVRLGLWVPAPDKAYWRSPQTRLWPLYLLRESLSQTNDVGAYCYLTDGGHFDNTGLYSLVERGCRFIVLVDNGADPAPCFEDMGNAIRRCRIDFGAEIELPIGGFRPVDGYGFDLAPDADHASMWRTDSRVARAHFALGRVEYCEPHLRALGWNELPRTGTIVWFKPAIVGDESADVRQYALQNSAFPHQTTTDQWFDESQFESYRNLGETCALAAFGTLKATAEMRSRSRLRPEDVERLFGELAEKFPLDRGHAGET